MKKLQINKETIRILTDTEAGDVQTGKGGVLFTLICDKSIRCTRPPNDPHTVGIICIEL